MNRYFAIVSVVILGCLVLAIQLGLSNLQATILLGVAAASMSPVAIHKVPNANFALGLLVGLTLFASLPLKKLLQFDGFLQEILLSILYGAVLWIIGVGWKRSWKTQK